MWECICPGVSHVIGRWLCVEIVMLKVLYFETNVRDAITIVYLRAMLRGNHRTLQFSALHESRHV
jgi:hypothetical protein